MRAGKTLDFTLLKSDLPSSFLNTKKRVIWIDLGYLGIKHWLPESLLFIPYRKPRKSKNNPLPKLTTFQKCYNRFVGSNRVLVEHTIAGLKRYNILTNKFRNKGIVFADEMITLAAGLWNFKVTNRLLYTNS